MAINMEDNHVYLPRIHVAQPLHEEEVIALPAAAARHVQVLRLQPNDQIHLFNGEGGQWLATIMEMGKNHVHALICSYQNIEREASVHVSLLVGIPANERMDFLIEKATELGVVHIYPLLFSRSVIKLHGERALKKLTHWQAIAIAACEQCGRNRIPKIHPVLTLNELLQHPRPELPSDRRMLCFRENAICWTASGKAEPVCILSGPEGGLSAEEENRLISEARFVPFSLGSRILRADTAPLAALSSFTLY